MEMVSQQANRVSLPQHSAVDYIKGAIVDHDNPFAVEGVRLHNMLTIVYVEQILNKCMKVMLLRSSIGTLLFGPVDKTICSSVATRQRHQAQRQDGRPE